MRTQDEIAAHINDVEDMFGFMTEVCAMYLDYEHAQPFLSEEATAAGWGDPKENSREFIISEMVDYLEFAFEKAHGQRGLSAGRSVTKMEAWLWLLVDEEMGRFAADKSNYAPYGLPILEAIKGKYVVEVKVV